VVGWSKTCNQANSSLLPTTWHP